VKSYISKRAWFIVSVLSLLLSNVAWAVVKQDSAAKLSDTQFISVAFNTNSTLREYLNPRTGMLSLHYPLATIPAKGGFNYKLILTYNPYDRSNRYSLSPGWSFNIAHYQNGTLYTANGGIYAMQGNHLQDYTLKNIRIETARNKKNQPVGYRIYNLKGQITYINTDPNQGAVGRTQWVQDRWGNKITFSYPKGLLHITDGYGQEWKLEVVPHSGDIELQFIKPDHTTISFYLTRPGGKLKGFTWDNNNKEQSQTTHIDYFMPLDCDTNTQQIQSIRYPLGGGKRVLPTKTSKEVMDFVQLTH